MLARLTATPGSNHTEDGCVYRDSRCDIQPWARAAHLTTVPQPSSGTVDEYLAYALSNNNSSDGEYVNFSALEVFLNDMRYINPRFTYLLTYLLTSQLCSML